MHSHISVPNISFSTEGRTNLLQDLDANKSPRPDGIPAAVLKACASEIAPILQVIFTQSLTTNCIPDDWLSANVVPIFKKGDRSSPSNYRPISLTSICCKLMEHVLYSSIMDHLTQHQLKVMENALSWCICRKCRPMTLDSYNKCCRQRDCVTNSSAFDNLVIDRDTLNIAIVHRIDFFVSLPDYSPASYRKAAYRQYIIWKYGHLGSKNCRVVPSCVTWAIRDKYPAPDGNYMGYKDY